MRQMFGCAVATALLAAGCASPAQVGAGPRPHPNYTSDTSANFFASTVAERLLKTIGKDPTYAGLAIRSFGLQVWAVGGGSPELRAAVAAVDELTVRIADVRNNLHDMEVLTTRLSHDTKALRQRGIAMAMWGPDYSSNTVKVWLEHYTPGRAAYLVGRYGADLVTVSTESETGAAS
jgi:hypothetical protein